ncbi:hypothetical protein [Aeromonas sobria]|jgi:hypothetical protein|uniref:hypothetical protein n=1 Tax=Aeromonas sobria TaxID=646 RepID=UPI003F4190E8
MKKIILSVIAVVLSGCAQHNEQTYAHPTSLELSRTSIAIKSVASEQKLDGQLHPYRIAVQGADAATIEKLNTMIGNKNEVILLGEPNDGKRLKVVSRPVICYFPAKSVPVWKYPCGSFGA